MLHFDTPTRTFTAGAALEEHRLVKLSGSTANTVTYCGVGEQPIGVTRNAVASGAPVTVFLLSKQGTITCTASGAITVNAAVMPAANGKIDDAATGKPIGVALNAATTDGQRVEVLVLPLETISGGGGGGN